MSSSQMRRNAGPEWGPAFIQQADRFVPWPLYRGCLALGSAVAVAKLPEQARYSRDFLSLLHGRPATDREVRRHFMAFSHLMVQRLRVARGVAHRRVLDPAHAGDFEALMSTGEAALFGTFHFGQSDLLGFLLGEGFNRRVSMIRLHMGNSDDVERLGRLFGKWISFIWVDDPQNLLFALKDAVESGASLAMQCDRVEFSAKAEPFRFLGAERLFPFTIYHLAVVFNRPVIFCWGLPGAHRDETIVHASTVYRPDCTRGRQDNLARARVHFQGVLNHLETLVRRDPHLWFNFLPLNPTVPAAGTG